MTTTEKSLKIKNSKHRKHKMHPNSLKNLIEYPKGVSGNQGSGSGYSLTSALKHSLDKPLKQPGKDAPARDVMVYSTLAGAILREPTPFRELWDRVEGKLQDKEQIRDINVVFVIGKGYRDLPQLTEGDNAQL